jgi:hypothetical protein
MRLGRGVQSTQEKSVTSFNICPYDSFLFSAIYEPRIDKWNLYDICRKKAPTSKNNEN